MVKLNIKRKPYQTLIFRCLHASQGLLATLGMITGYWIYNTWDHRWGQLPLPTGGEAIIDFHSGVGELFTSASLIFILYSLGAGRRRLLQPKSFKQLGKIGHPIWWYSLHRFVNTGLLIMGVLIILSGEALEDDVLKLGIFSDLAYSLHLFSWAGMVCLTFAHIGLSGKIGGVPLILSMFSTHIRSSDYPTRWPQRFYQWGKDIFF